MMKTVDAVTLKQAFLNGARNLEVKKEWINELNVFPVPDGDTGTNMSMTIMAAAREVAAVEEPTMAVVFEASTSPLVGSSTAMGAISVTGLSGSVMMSPMSASSMPMTATISPASAAVTSALPRFSKVYTLRICARRSAPSGFTTSTCSFSCNVPEDRRPTPIRPS